MEKIHIVNRGVDTLGVNAYYTDDAGLPCKRDLPESFATQLEEWKRQAQRTHEPFPTSLDFRHATLHMQANGAGRGQWQWMLKTDDITLYNTFEGNMLYLQASLIDLCADVAGWREVGRLDKKRNFVSRSIKRRDHSEGEQLLEMKSDSFSSGLHDTGFDFSVKKSPVRLTIYDKTREMRTSGKSWFVPLWEANGWDAEKSPVVWRVEAKFSREALHTIKQGDILHGIEDAYEVEQHLPLLWAYAVGHAAGGDDGLPDGWLRCVRPTKDTNRARWPSHPAWVVVQNAFQEPNTTPQHFGKIIRQAHEQRNIEKALEAVVGYGSSLSAWVGGSLASPDTDFSLFLHWLAENVPDFLEEKNKDFAREVQRKLVKLYRRPLGNVPAGSVPDMQPIVDLDTDIA